MLIMSPAHAQNDSTFKYDPTLQYGSKPQTQAETPEQLHKKLVIARDAIASIMGSKMGTIPFNEVDINEMNSTLDVGIDSAKATLSEEQYLKKIKEIVGDIPIKITFGQITALPLILPNNSVHGNDATASIPSPLDQFKSGISPKDVTCNQGLQLIFKAEDNSPACVKADTAFHLSVLGWGYLPDPFVTKMDLLDSNITGGKITEFQYSPQGANIVIKIQTTSNGNLTVIIPKVVTDLSPYYLFKTYEVLDDGKEVVDVNKITTTKGPRFIIPFTNGTNEIEIMGIQVGQMTSK